MNPSEISGRFVKVRMLFEFDKKNFCRISAAASEHFLSWYEIAFRIDTMVVWDSELTSCANTMFSYDCLLKCVDKGHSDLVIHFAKEINPYQFHIMGISLFEFGYLRVVQGAWVHNKAGFQTAYMTLLHELGHLFGGYHVVHDGTEKTISIMNPVFINKLVVKEGFTNIIKIPDWHPANEIIIRAVRDRPLNEADWDSSFWSPIQKGYQESRRLYNNFRFSPDGKLETPFELCHPISDYYYFTATFAALCGMKDQALALVDTMGMVVNAMERQCRDCGGRCPKGICGEMPSGESNRKLWLEWKRAYVSFVRARVLARCGDIHEARRTFLEFLEAIPRSEREDRNKYQLGFNLYLQHVQAVSKKMKLTIEK